MAQRKPNKRVQKKQQKKKTTGFLEQKGIQPKEYKKLSAKERENLLISIIEDERKKDQLEAEKREQRKAKKREKAKALRDWKKQKIKYFNLEGFSTHSSKKDIEKAIAKRQKEQRKQRKVRKLVSLGYGKDEAEKLAGGRKPITFDEIKKLEKDRFIDGNKEYDISPYAFAFGWRDFSENLTMGEIYSYSEFFSEESLRGSLAESVDRKHTFNKKQYRKSKGKRGKSSGFAGDYRYFFGDIEGAENFPEQRGNEDYTFFNNNGEFAIYKFTLWNIATIVHSVMNHITEDVRDDFYRKFYKDITYVIPEAVKYFPSPH